jgi:hypothetical protein
MNTVIPEFISRVNYKKGPFYADVGNCRSAGSAHLGLFKTLPQNILQVEGGMYGYGRAVFGATRRLGDGNILYGGEVYQDDGLRRIPTTTTSSTLFLSIARAGKTAASALLPGPIMVDGTQATI